MTSKVFVRDLEILQNLQTELSQFNSGVNKVLDNAARDIKSVKEHLRSRADYWNAELRRRESILTACQSYTDEYKDCSSELAAVREANSAIEKLQRLSAGLEQAVGEYQPYSNRLRKVLDAKIGSAKGDLQRSIEKYRQYLGQSTSTLGSTNLTDTSGIKVPSTDVTTSKSGITWAEYQTILNKWKTGYISFEELRKLGQPISDLQTMTIAEDYSGVEQLLDSQQFYEITRDSHEADNLREAILVTLKAINYWRNKS